MPTASHTNLKNIENIMNKKTSPANSAKATQPGSEIAADVTNSSPAKHEVRPVEGGVQGGVKQRSMRRKMELDEEQTDAASQNASTDISEAATTDDIILAEAQAASAAAAKGSASATASTAGGAASTSAAAVVSGQVATGVMGGFSIGTTVAVAAAAGLAVAAGGSSDSGQGESTDTTDTTDPVITSSASASVNENVSSTAVVYRAVATDNAGSVTYSLKATGDYANFNINATTGVVTFKSGSEPDFETKSAYAITVIATDAAGNAVEKAVAVSINDLDETAPVISSGATADAIDENTGAAQVVYQAVASDDGGVTFSLKAVGDYAAFSIDPSTGAVTLTADPDYETKSSYSFTVVATDAAGNGAERAVTLDVNDLVDTNADGGIMAGPVIDELLITLFKADGSVLASGTVDSTNGTYQLAIPGGYVGPITAVVMSDGDADYDYWDEATNSGVMLTSPLTGVGFCNGGNITLYITPLTTIAAQAAGINTSALLAGEPVNITLTAAQLTAVNSTVAQALGLPANFNITNPGGAIQPLVNSGGTANTSVDPYGKVLAMLSSMAKLFGDSASAIDFLVSGMGIDVNNPPSAPVAVALPPALAFVMTMAAADDTLASLLTSAGVSPSSFASSVGITTESVASINASAIESALGKLTFADPAALTARISAVETSFASLATVFLAVDFPLVFTSAARGAALTDGSSVTGTVYQASAFDPDAPLDTPAYSIVQRDNDDSALFSIDAATGAVSFLAPTTANFEGKSQYVFTVEASIGGQTLQRTITLPVFNIDELAPVFTSGDTAAARAENAGPGLVIYRAQADDSHDISRGVTYSFADDEDDHAELSIDSKTGEVRLVGNPDFETKSSYTFTVRASDGVNDPVSKTVTFAVTNRDEVAPEINSEATADINENSPAGTVIYQVLADDSADTSAGMTYRLKAGAGDVALLSINAEGEVSVRAGINFEAKESYAFTVLVSDGVNAPVEKEVVVLVNNLDEAAPVITSAATAEAIYENTGRGRVVYQTVADDSADASAGVHYRLAESGDWEAFSINSRTGAVTLLGNPDYETKTGYSFTVIADDGINEPVEKTVTLSVLDRVAEYPLFSSAVTAEAVNDDIELGAGVAVYTATATNLDGSTEGITYSLAGVPSISYVNFHTVDTFRGMAYADVIADGVAITRDAREPLYTVGVLWNADGWDGLTSVAERRYFSSMEDALANSLGGSLAFDPLGLGPGAAGWVMFDPQHGTYYKFDVHNFGQEDASYSRSLIDTATGETGVATVVLVADLLQDGSGDVVAAGVTLRFDGTSLFAAPTVEWNADGWTDVADLANVATRTYSTDISDAFSGMGSDTLEQRFVLHDLVNDRYYTVEFSYWGGKAWAAAPSGGGAGGFAYVRTPITLAAVAEPQEGAPAFTASLGDAVSVAINDGDVVVNADVLDSGVVLTRYWGGPLQGVPTLAWNAEGWDDLTDLATRQYSTSMSTVPGDEGYANIGNRVLLNDWVMHDLVNDTYYKVHFTDWSQNGSGGGVAYVRTQVDAVTGAAIGEPVEFVKEPNTNAYDFIDDGVVLVRGSAQQLSSGGITWNADGWSDLSNLEARSWHPQLSSWGGGAMDIDPWPPVGVQLVMHDLIADKYYKVLIDAWQQSGGGAVSYTRTEIIPGALDNPEFSIDPVTGVVTLLADPDYANKESYTFTVVATDADGNTTERSVILPVNDRTAPDVPTDLGLLEGSDSGVAGDGMTNDTTPTITGFGEAGATITLFNDLNENAIVDEGEILGTDVASERDGSWAITPATALEAGAYGMLKVFQTDAAGNVGQATSINTLSIETTPPVFTSNDVAQSINENSGASQAVYTAQAEDANSPVTYSLAAVAVTTLGEPLTATKANNVSFIDTIAQGVTLTRANTGGPLLSSKTSDNLPTILWNADGWDNLGTVSSRTYVSFAAALQNRVGELVLDAQLVMHDVIHDTYYKMDVTQYTGGGSGGGFSYVRSPIVMEEMTLDDSHLFSIDTDTGIVTLNDNPDYESQAAYTFTVVATDAAGNSSEKIVTLSINDLEEIPPVFLSPAEANAIDENAQVGETGLLVYTAQASDNSGGMVTYSVTDDADSFRINPETGEVFLITDPDASISDMSFVVSATDEFGNVSSQTVNLHLNDVTEPVTPPTIVLFDFISGEDYVGTSLDALKAQIGQGAFNPNESYDIYIRVPADLTNAVGSYISTWQGVQNLNGDDKITLIQGMTNDTVATDEALDVFTMRNWDLHYANAANELVVTSSGAVAFGSDQFGKLFTHTVTYSVNAVRPNHVVALPAIFEDQPVFTLNDGHVIGSGGSKVVLFDLSAGEDYVGDTADALVATPAGITPSFQPDVSYDIYIKVGDVTAAYTALQNGSGINEWAGASYLGADDTITFIQSGEPTLDSLSLSTSGLQINWADDSKNLLVLNGNGGDLLIKDANFDPANHTSPSLSYSDPVSVNLFASNMVAGAFVTMEAASSVPGVRVGSAPAASVTFDFLTELTPVP